jgi:hypothetical protein
MQIPKADIPSIHRSTTSTKRCEFEKGKSFNSWRYRKKENLYPRSVST